MNLYQPINIPIALGKQILTPECAYFLGAILSANESFVYEGKRYWLAPVRHNPKKDIDITQEINEHMQFLQQMIGRANGRIYTKNDLHKNNWFGATNIMNAFKSKLGFTTIFESDESTTIDAFFDDATMAIDNSSPTIVQAFIVGAFDGRSTPDQNMKTNQIRYLTLDCQHQGVASYLRTLLEKYGIDTNYNKSRERIEGGEPRKHQLRINGRNIPLFMEKIGIVSPNKFEQIRSTLDSALNIHVENNILWGLKTLTEFPQAGDVLEFFSQETVETEDSLDYDLLKEVNYTVGDPNFNYSGTPKRKADLVDMKGRQIYRRDRKVSANALTIAENLCEIDRAHPSFVRKNSDFPYSEPHHLIPVAFHEMFTVSLDIEENIVSLCSNCHNQLHYGKDITPLLVKLYEQRADLLRSVGIDVSLQELLKMYNA